MNEESRREFEQWLETVKYDNSNILSPSGLAREAWQAAKYSVTARHITKLANNGEITGIKLGRDWRFNPETVQQELEAKTFQHVKQKMSKSK
jgi:excisionase family DNA binding protein